MFFGRNSELDFIVDLLERSHPARIAILGGPGMGKTSLALAALHDPRISNLFTSQYFVACDAAEGRGNIESLLGAALDITAPTPSRLRTKIIKFLSNSPCVLVLDNFESAWETPDLRLAAEQSLAALCAVESLSVIITLRGSERPAGIPWTRPFLDPLSPLALDATLQMFLTISDAAEDDPCLRPLLQNLDNMPLAVTLMASLAQYQSCSSLLEDWNARHTAMLARGSGKTRLSSLDFSIELSLQSNTVSGIDGTLSMLSVLSLLPDGADEDLLNRISGTVRWPLRAVSALLKGCLVYRGSDEYIKMLAPIREYILSKYPPPNDHLDHVLTQFENLVRDIITRDSDDIHASLLSTLAAYMGNISAVFQYALQHDIRVPDIIHLAIDLQHMVREDGLTSEPLLKLVLSQAEAHNLRIEKARCLLLLHAHRGQTSYGEGHLLYEALDIFRAENDIPGQFESLRKLIELESWDPTSGRSPQTELLELLTHHSDSLEADNILRGISTIALGHFRHSRIHQARETLASAAVLAEQSLKKPAYDTPVGVYFMRVGDVETVFGALQRANAAYERSLEAALRQGNKRRQAACYLCLGHVAQLRSDISRSLEHLHRCKELLHEQPDAQIMGYCLGELTKVLIKSHRLDEASLYLAEYKKLSIVETMAYYRGFAAVLHGELSLAEGDADDAILHFLSASETLGKLGMADSEADALLGAAEAALHLQYPLVTATRYIVLAAIASSKEGYVIETSVALSKLASVFLLENDLGAAQQLAQSVLPTLLWMGLKREAADSLFVLAKVGQRTGKLPHSKAAATKALEIYEAAEDKRGSRLCQAFLDNIQSN